MSLPKYVSIFFIFKTKDYFKKCGNYIVLIINQPKNLFDNCRSILNLTLNFILQIIYITKNIAENHFSYHNQFKKR